MFLFAVLQHVLHLRIRKDLVSGIIDVRRISYFVVVFFCLQVCQYRTVAAVYVLLQALEAQSKHHPPRNFATTWVFWGRVQIFFRTRDKDFKK